MDASRLQRLRRLFAPPVFPDEERTQQAGLLNVTLLTGGLFIVALLMGNLVNGFRYAILLPVELGTLAAYVAMWALMRRGHITTVAWMLLLLVTAAVTLALVVLGSGGAVIAGGYLIIILGAGLLLSTRAAVALTAAIAAIVLTLVWGEAHGLLAHRVVADPMTRSITYTGLFALTAGIVLLSRRQSDGLLRRYRVELAERRRAEDALRYTQARLLGLLTAIPDFIFVLNPDGVYQDVFTGNETGLLRPAAEVRGCSVFDLLPLEQAQAFVEVIRRAADSERVINYEYSQELDAVPGERRWYQARVVGYDVPEGRRVLWLARETTEAHRAARALEQLTSDLEQRVHERTARLEEVNRELEAFAYSVSHDLRAPLRAVNGYARLLDQDYGPSLPEDARNMLVMLRQGATQMGRQIDDLLRLARLADRPLRRQPVSMLRLAETAAQSLLAGCAGERSVRLELDDMPPASADQALLERVYTNLLDNALKYTRACPEAQIHAGALQLNGGIVYFVRDNGIGFDMNAAEHIFAAFQRLHTEHEYEGSGLGLAIARRIVERHGGRIWAESRPGQGAAFYFTLPE